MKPSLPVTMKRPLLLLCLVCCEAWFVPRARAFDDEGHRLINRLALALLPTNFPAFVHDAAARERIVFLGGEPDRWRNTDELSLKHVNNPNHYFDLEDLGPLGMTPAGLSPFRYEFVAQWALARAAHPERFAPLDLARDLERVRSLPGFLPWTITEFYAQLESAFSSWAAFREGGTPDEYANATQNLVYTMGLMSHFVGDAAQPLHTTVHYNGWIGPNPNGYTTNRSFHAWIDGGFLRTTEFPSVTELGPRMRPPSLLWTNSVGTNSPVFAQVVRYILAQHQQVEPLYQLEKAGKLAVVTNTPGEGRELLCHQIAVAAQMLGDLWYTAWQQAPPDKYLESALMRRKEGGPVSGR